MVVISFLFLHLFIDTVITDYLKSYYTKTALVLAQHHLFHLKHFHKTFNEFNFSSVLILEKKSAPLELKTHSVILDKNETHSIRLLN